VLDAHLIENEVIVKTDSDHPDYQWTVASPIQVAGQQKRVPTEAPAIGADSRQIMAELGYAEVEIERLIAAGIIKA
jgi:crotonobetainyl-CoA:carnitine CoA-transferase CaiB-like acyl-CoA transferase